MSRSDDWVCIGSGPSLTRNDVDYVKGKAKVIAVNDNYRLAPWADIVYAMDAQWWATHIANIRETVQGSELCIPDYGANKKTAKVHHLKQIKSNRGRWGLGSDAVRGGYSGYQALNLAYLRGARRIIMLGYDMQGTHWFGNHPSPLRNPPIIRKWIPHFGELYRDLKNEGVELINCTRNTAIDCVPQAVLRDVLK